MSDSAQMSFEENALLAFVDHSDPRKAEAFVSCFRSLVTGPNAQCVDALKTEIRRLRDNPR